MALRKIIDLSGKTVLRTEFGNIETGNNQISISAYIKVLNVNGNKEQVIASVQFTSDKITYNQNFNVPVNVTNDSSNYIKQTYEYLKTLPEFSGSEDC